MTTLSARGPNVCIRVSAAQAHTRITPTEFHVQILRRRFNEGRCLDGAQEFESFIRQLSIEQHVCIRQHVARQL